MLRRYVGPLIGLAVFVVLLIIVLVTAGGGGGSTTNPAIAPSPTVAAADKDLQILNLPATEPITMVEIKTVTSTVTLKLDESGWKQTAPAPLVLDSALISDTLRQVSTLKGSEIIPADKAGNLAGFGFDNPTMTLTLTSSGGPKVLLFGAFNQPANSYYVKLSNDPKVWTLNSFYFKTFQSWTTAPPTPAPSVAPVGVPQTPLATITPTSPPAPTTAGSPGPTPTVPTTPGVTPSAAATTAATTTTVAATPTK